MIKKYRLSLWSKFLLAVFGIVVVLVAGAISFQKTNPAKAQTVTTASAPTIHIQWGDAQDTTPHHPGDCDRQLGQDDTSTTDGNNPDCLRVRVLEDTYYTQYTQDFRFCLQLNGAARACTAWATEIAGSYSVSPMTYGGQNGQLAGTMAFQVETRSMTDAGLPAGATLRYIVAGVALAYQKNQDPCRTSSGMAWSPLSSPQGSPSGNWSGWAYGDTNDDDPGCFQVGMMAGELTMPPNAEYVSTTIPAQLPANKANNGNYTITMKNKGMPWLVRDWQEDPNASVVRPSTCSTNPADYPNGEVCNDYVIYSSQRWRLMRTDNTPVGVKSKALVPMSNDVSYANGQYTYAGADTDIVANPSTPTTTNTIPFMVRQDISYHREQGTYEVCNPNPTGGGGDNDPPILLYKNNSFLGKIAGLFTIKKAQAEIAPIGSGGDPGETCTWESYDYVQADTTPPNPNVYTNESGNFVPVNITTPDAGTYVLEFQMVDMQHLNDNAAPYTQGRFGSPADITINAYSPFVLSCDASHTVNAGTPATYVVSATPGSGFSSNIVVTMTSQEDPGPTASPTSTTLTSPGYTGTMNVLTTGLSSGVYHLTFTGTAAQGTSTCQAVLNINGDVDLKFNHSDNPAPIANGASGQLEWTTHNVSSCTASSTPATSWSGARSAAPTELTENIGPLAEGSYTFHISCGAFYDDVTVIVGNPAPTATLRCRGNGDSAPKAGPCQLLYGGSGLVYWDYTSATNCTVSGFDPAVYLTRYPNDSSNVSTGNLTNPPATKTYTLNCTGINGSRVTSSVTFNVNSVNAPTADMKCQAPGDSTPKNGPCTLTSGQSGILTWNTTNVSSCSIAGFNPALSVNTNENTGISTGNLIYPPGTQTFTLNCTGSNGNISDAVTFNVNQGGGNAPPSSVTTNTAVCEKVTLTWHRPTSGPAPSSYKLYWTATSDGNGNPNQATWVNIPPDVTDTGDIEYSYPDTSHPTGVSYYGVTAITNGNESVKAWAYAVPNPCASNLSASDKDVYAVNGDLNTDISSCGGSLNPDVVAKKFGLLRQGDLITFKINICNSGDLDSNINLVTDTLTNLSKPTGGWSAQYQDGTGSYDLAPSELEDLHDGQGKVTGVKFKLTRTIRRKTNNVYGINSIVFKAQVQAPANSPGGVYRFQNRAVISEVNGTNTSVSTPLFLFSTGSGSPDLKEVAP